MGIEELQIIAEIIGGLEQTGITGLLVYLGYGVLEMLLTAGVILIVIWCAYKILNRLLSSGEDQKRLHAIAGLLGEKTYGTFMHDEYTTTCRAIQRNLKHEGRLEENNKRLKDYMERLGSLTKDYEALWDEHELAKETMARQTKMIRQLDESINTKYDKEEPSEREDQQDTGALSGRDADKPER